VDVWFKIATIIILLIQVCRRAPYQQGIKSYQYQWPAVARSKWKRSTSAFRGESSEANSNFQWMDLREKHTHTHYRYLIWSNDIYRSLKHGFYAPNLFFEYPSNISNSARNRRSILNPPNPLLDSKLSSSVKLGALWRLKMRAAERDHAMGMVFLMLNPHRNRNTVFLLQTFS
jgi:hypothetical protein